MINTKMIAKITFLRVIFSLTTVATAASGEEIKKNILFLIGR